MNINKLSRKEKIELLKLLEEKKRREDMRNPVYDVLKLFKGRVAVLMGGSGSGKSYAIADHILDRIVQENNGKPHRILCVRAERKQVSESQFPLLEARAYAKYPNLEWKINRAKGGEAIKIGDNEILFAGLDDVNKLKSIFDITSIWGEEFDQCSPEDYRELNRRLRGFDGLMQIYISLNPVSQLCWIKSEFFDTRNKRTVAVAGVDPFEDFSKDIDFDFDKMTTETYEGVDLESFYYDKLLVHTTFKDNKFIDAGYAKQMAELKISSPEEYVIYALGHWGVMGNIYFNKSNIAMRMREVRKPLRAIDFIYTVKFDETTRVKSMVDIKQTEGYYLNIIEEPEPYVPYVIGGDTAGEGSDWNTAVIRNNITGKEVAYIRTQADEDTYAEQVVAAGYFYNMALIGIEINFSTRPMKIAAKDFNYPNVYLRGEAPDKFTEKPIGKFGFHTNMKTRPYILGQLQSVMKKTPWMVTEYDTLSEMTTFAKNEKGKPEAMGSTHDDMILAWAITEGIRGQQRFSLMYDVPDMDMSRVPEDYMEDYYNCDEQFKPLLVARLKELGYID